MVEAPPVNEAYLRRIAEEEPELARTLTRLMAEEQQAITPERREHLARFFEPAPEDANYAEWLYARYRHAKAADLQINSIFDRSLALPLAHIILGCIREGVEVTPDDLERYARRGWIPAPIEEGDACERLYPRALALPSRIKFVHALLAGGFSEDEIGEIIEWEDGLIDVVADSDEPEVDTRGLTPEWAEYARWNARWAAMLTELFMVGEFEAWVLAGHAPDNTPSKKSAQSPAGPFTFENLLISLRPLLTWDSPEISERGAVRRATTSLYWKELARECFDLELGRLDETAREAALADMRPIARKAANRLLEHPDGRFGGFYVDAARLREAIQSVRPVRPPQLSPPTDEAGPGPAVRTPPSIPSLFRGGEAQIPSSVALRGFLAACHNAAEGASRWTETNNGIPSYTFRQRQGAMIVSMRLPEETSLDPALAATLWSQVKQLADADADVLLAALARWMEPAHRDAQGATWITATAVLDCRGIKPKMKRDGAARYRAGHRWEDIAEIAASLERLDRIWVELQQIKVLEHQRGRRPRERQLTLESKLVNVTDRISQSDLDGGKLPVAWHYRPGRWIEPFLEAPNRQVAILLQKALMYDPYRRLWEKRLARYFTFHLRIGARTPTPLRRKIGGIMEELSLPIDQRNPERTRQRFEAALHRLRDDALIASWEYTGEAQAALSPSNLPARGWLATWLDAAIEVVAPPTVQRRYDAIAQRPRAGKAGAATRRRGADDGHPGTAAGGS